VDELDSANKSPRFPSCSIVIIQFPAVLCELRVAAIC
jgi:hypothetical protein